jgi:[acyl-carrier-protein] S-malonyltransferase
MFRAYDVPQDLSRLWFLQGQDPDSNGVLSLPPMTSPDKLSELEPIALLFPGQGSQFCGMAKEIVERGGLAESILDRADEALGYPLSRIMDDGDPEELNRTVHTQPAVFVHSAALLELFRKSCNFLTPVAAAGHSLGEYTALYAAGVFDFESALKVVQVRAAGMDQSQPEGACAMAAIIGMSLDSVSALVESQRGSGVLEIANVNSPDQVVVSGHSEAIHRVLAAASKEKRVRSVILPVSSAFHTNLMEPCRESLYNCLKLIRLENPKFPVLSNIEAEYYPDDADGIRRLLLGQIVKPVLWEKCVRKMLGMGIKTFIEIGPGKVLTGLTRRIERNAKVFTINNRAALDKFLEEYH